MNSEQPASGSRWEPTAHDEQPTGAGAPAPEPVDTRPARPGRRRRALVAAAAAGLLLVGGAGGFAVGRATAPVGPPTSAQADRDGFRGPDRGFPDDDDAPALPGAAGPST
ncbi:hypothetical protein GCM10017691_56890 [Pseudonocardia petroleophila]|uniref:Uncharacterized protein n=1 Tax=Pseudonocardia petroleophila TaxID=37331 RepID=A0A7G7MN97_9PSEU|nr:hypothetical protein [Pseudonocardia petroleophila]QNG54258.1 hypothetical protein H6H00_10390 [Pseudonocardia petroleophila]